ncbi:MAG: hypothetical protein QOH26_782 [Actinomycetota bacterium]|jgi:predicted ArsR family transcriptional regulator|nr:hypothetical protein [Actinomycetota bacterium]
MAPLGDSSATRTAKVLSLPKRADILSLLLTSGPKTVKEIADEFDIHPNVARAHLELMVEAGFLWTETRRRDKGRPAKVYFTWEGEAGALSEAGVESLSEARAASVVGQLEGEVRVLERLLQDATRQLGRIHELIEQQTKTDKGGNESA